MVKALAKEKDQLERERWDLRRQSKEASENASALHSQLDLKENRIKELEAELAMVSQTHTHTHTHTHTDTHRYACVNTHTLNVREKRPSWDWAASQDRLHPALRSASFSLGGPGAEVLTLVQPG